MNSIDERLNELNSKIMTKRRLSSKIKELKNYGSIEELKEEILLFLQKLVWTEKIIE